MMPFTVAHTIAVLPWVRKPRLSATALVAGSMSPDFEYFARMSVKGIWGHDLPGILFFDLPMTVVIVTVFHLVVKNNLIDNLPAFLQRRFSHLKALTLREDMLGRPVTFALCACLGALTHVIWDGFTHGTGYFVHLFSAVYKDTIVPFKGARYPLWYALQNASTLVGLTGVAIYVMRMKPSSSPVVRPGLAYWIMLTTISGAAVLVRLQFPHQAGLPMVVIASITGMCAGMIVLGLLLSRREIASSK